jgi:exodeoxyribonuclease V gamma subunit
VLHRSHSNSLERLVEALAAAITRRRSAVSEGPFETAHVVVPNRTVRTYVQFELARSQGVVANTSFRYLNPFLESLVPASDRRRVLDRETLEVLLIAVLARPALGPGLEAVQDYIHAAGEDRDVLDRRRAQLASRLARTFDDLALARPDVLVAWRRGATLADDHTQKSTEAWQRLLWLEVFGEAGVLARIAREGPALFPLPVLLEDASALAVPPVVHVFGFPYLAPLHARLLEGLATRALVHVYTFAPARRDGHAAVRRFGGPGREGVRFFASPATDLSRSPPGDSLLHRLQGDILDGRAPRPYRPDGSIRIHACSSVGREVEVVAGEIWSLVRDAARRREKLRFDEIAVFIAGREPGAYRSQIASVFQQAHDLPVSFLDESGARESRLVEAVRLLLELPLGTFTRNELLRLMTHPAVQDGVPDPDPEQWLAWCEALGILHGADRDDQAGTYVTHDIARDLYNWDQGAKRLALGVFLAGERSRDERPVALGGREYLPLDLAQDEIASGARFLLLARSLVADARFARSAERTLGEWAHFLHAYVLAYLHARDPEEERLLEACARRLRRLEDLDVDPLRPAVSYRVAFELARAALESVGPGRGHDLAGGVNVASYLPMRPIPWKAVFVLGLGENGFPASSRGDLLDLTLAERRPGDVSPQERDAHLFLETLAATGEQLTLSYVARDGQTGEALAPSSIVRELEAILGHGYLSSKEVEGLTERHPLRRFDPAELAPPLGTGTHEPILPEAWKEAQVRALRESLRAHAGGVEGPLGAGAKATIDALLGTEPLPEPPVAAPGTTTRLSLTALLDFLVSPLQGWAKHRLRLEAEDRADILGKEDEPWTPAVLDATALLRSVFFEALALGSTFPEAVDRVYREHASRMELAATLPTGVFLEALSAAHRRVLESWHFYATASRFDLASLATHRFGAAFDAGRADLAGTVVHPALVLDLPSGARVELSGRTQRITADGSASVSLVLSGKPGERHALRAFLDHALLAASGVPCAAVFRALVAPGKKGNPLGALRRIQPFTQAEARAYLAAIAADFLGGPHAYLLPLEAVLDHLVNGRGLAWNIRSQRDKAFNDDRGSDAHGPIAHPERFEPPRDAEVLARRRLGPFVERGGAS